MPRPPRPRDPDQKYPVDICRPCGHLGGLHVTGRWVNGGWHDDPGCRCGQCPGWDEASFSRGWWSDRQTDELASQKRSTR